MATSYEIQFQKLSDRVIRAAVSDADSEVTAIKEFMEWFFENNPSDKVKVLSLTSREVVEAAANIGEKIGIEIKHYRAGAGDKER